MEKIEKIIVHWVAPRRYRLILFFLVILMIISTAYIPYINLISNFYLVWLVSLVAMPLILDIDHKIFFAAGTMLFFLTALLWFIGQTEEAEVLTEYIYIILLSGTINALFSSKKVRKKDISLSR